MMHALRSASARVTLSALAVLAAAGLIGCAGPGTGAAERAFVAYVDATHAAPSFRGYVEADSSLTPEQKARRIAAIDAADAYAASIRTRDK